MDGIRGYAAIAVTIYHAILFFNNSLVNDVLYKPIQEIDDLRLLFSKLLLILFNGETAVILFFVMSGIVLFESLKRNEYLGGVINSLVFIIKRVLRIYPTLIVSLVLFYVVMEVLNYLYPNTFTDFSINQLINNSLLYNISMHGASWTLQVEIMAVLFIVLGFYIYKFSKLLGLILFFLYSIIIIDNPNIFIPLPINTAISICLIYFATGFLISTEIGKTIIESLSNKSWIATFIVFLAIRHIVPHSSFTGLVVQDIASALFVGSVYYSKGEKIVKFLSNRFSVYLGKISFSFYLTNVIFLNIFCRLLLLIPISTNYYLEFGLLASILTIVASLPLSHFIEKVIEQPSIKCGRKIENAISSFVIRKKRHHEDVTMINT